MSLLSTLLNLCVLSLFIISTPTLITIGKKQYADYLSPRPKIGIIFFPPTIDQSHPSTVALGQLFKNEWVKGVVLALDCTHISPGTAQAIAQEIEYLKKEYPKPVVTFIENKCEGYAYLIACAADAIVAPGGATVVTAFGEPEGSNPDSAAVDIEKQYLSLIGLRRKLSLKNPESWAKGTFSGAQAYTIHLVDHVGSMSVITNIIKEKALIDGEVEWIEKNLRAL